VAAAVTAAAAADAATGVRLKLSSLSRLCYAAEPDCLPATGKVS